MICERGRVVAQEEAALWVETITQSSCSTCSAQKGCGQGLMNSLHDGRRNQLRVSLSPGQAAADYPVGSDVEFAVAESVLVGGALFVYLLPLFSLIAGMLAASKIAENDAVAALGGGLGFCLGLLVVRVHAVWGRNKSRYEPKLIGLYRLSDPELVAISEHL